jgi:peptidoglycan hydrolase-like protein with peptidoglycan-binding domain
MVDSEDAQLLSMVGFLRDSKLDGALRAHDWAKFARGYNGPSFAQNQYDIKLEVQYARFSSGSAPDIELRTAQAALTLLGFQPGKIDGLMGKRTREALRGFQTTAALTVNGELDGATYAALSASAGF